MAKIRVITNSGVFIDGEIFYDDGKEHTITDTVENKNIADQLVSNNEITITQAFSSGLNTDDIKEWLQNGAPVTVNGSLMELRGLAANKPAASAVTVGATYWSVDTDPHGNAVEVSNGTTWTVI